MACHLKECNSAVDSTTGRVEVRAFQVTSSEVAKLLANWQSSGDAVFHPNCWAKLNRATKPKSGSGPTLSDLETKLVVEANKHAEYHDPDPKIKAEVARIVDMLRRSDYCIAFTGAGISTAAGIGDFRGKDGKWTDREKRQEHGAKGSKQGAGRGYKLSDLRPTYTHEAILKLLQLGHIKFLISQNTDGLHRLSGIPEQKISELHGNAFVEKCEKCESRYERPLHYRVYNKDQTSAPPKPCERCRINHRTGHVCERKGCNGYLMNTIINFGDFLEEHVLNSATEHAKKADLVLCLGSTLRVSPANALVEMGQQPPRLIICNRQGTPYDDYCTQVGTGGVPLGSRIFGDCDKLMRQVMLAILGSDGAEEWEEARDERMREYERRRR